MVIEQIESYTNQVGILWEKISRELDVNLEKPHEDFLLELRLVFYEIVVNAIEHAHGEDGRPLIVKYQIDEKQVKFIVIDSGPGFDWGQQASDCLDLEAESSRGLFIINNLVDTVEYKKTSEGNEVTIIKKITTSSHDETHKIKIIKNRYIVVCEDFFENWPSFSKDKKIDISVVKSRGELITRLKSENTVDAVVICLDNHFEKKIQFIDEVNRYFSGSTPILIVSLNKDSQYIVDAFEKGAYCLLQAPLSHSILDVNLKALFHQKDIAEEHRDNAEELSRQLNEARTLQMSILPPKTIEYKNVHFSSYFTPCNYVGGDMVGYFPLSPDHVAFYVADVSGHGVASAMFALWLNRTMLPHNGINSVTKKPLNEAPFFQLSTPAEVCHILDQTMTDNDDQQYLTMFYGIIDQNTGIMDYCCAGHPEPFLIDEFNQVTVLEGSNPPIGMGLGLEFNTHSIQLKIKQRVFVYSDCAIECFGKDNREQFGSHRLMESIEKTGKDSLALQIDKVSQILENYNGSQNFNDDLTLLNVQYHL